MVDSINGAGGPPNVSQVSRTQNNRTSENKQAEGASSAAATDEVNISQEALSLSQAEQTARETRTILEEQLDEALSGGGGLDELL